MKEKPRVGDLPWRAMTRDDPTEEEEREEAHKDRPCIGSPKGLGHVSISLRSCKPHHVAPLMTTQDPSSVEERQSRQMKSFLQNFLSDDCARFQRVLDLHQHALDAGISVTDATLQEVVRVVPHVQGLTLSGCSQITDAGLWSIARHCPALQEIALAGCSRITELGIRVLAHSCQLRAINLSDCAAVDDGVLQSLAAGSWMLQRFTLQRSRRVTDAGLVKLAQCCKDLRHLDVSECEHVGEYGDKALLELARHCHELRVLDLFGCRHVQDRGVRAIADGCPHLTTLKLTGCHGVTGAALRALARHCHELEVLSLAGCVHTTNETLAELARHCPRLHWLDISGSPAIDATGVRALAQYCPDLQYLNLSDCPRVGDSALRALSAQDSGSRLSLTTLKLARCPRITETGVELLARACPNLLTLDLTEAKLMGRRFLQRLVQELAFVEWATTFFGYQPLPNAAQLCLERDLCARQERSAVKLQALMRGCLARGGVWQAKLRYVERRVLPHIQARVRGFLTRKRLADEKVWARQRQAAVFISEMYLNWKLRRRLAQHRRLLRIRESRDAAAIVFQKRFRGYAARRRVAAIQEEKRYEAHRQACLRAMLELAAVKVQRAYRGHCGRSDASLLRASRDAHERRQQREQQAARILQRIYRGHRGRAVREARLQELLHQKQRQCGAIAMQRLARGHRARRQARVLREEAEAMRALQAAKTIQRYWRGLKDKHLAAVLIGLVQLRAREQLAARVIQAAYRAHTSRGFMKALALAQQMQKRRVLATALLQRMARGHRGRALAEVQRELRKLEYVARPLFERQQRCTALVEALTDKVAVLRAQLTNDEQDEASLTHELEKTMQIQTKYHDSARLTGTPQRFLTQYLQVQLADQLRGKRMALAMAHQTLETLVTELNDAGKQLRAVNRQLEPLTQGVVLKTREHRTKRLQTQVRRQRVAATHVQRVFRGYRVRCAVREGANCWLELVEEEVPQAGRATATATATAAAGAPHGRTYYYNTFSGESRWRKPLAMTLFQDEFVAPMPLPESVDTLALDSGASLPVSHWYEAFDDCVGQTYYYNAVTKEYQWEKPDSLEAFRSDSESARRRLKWLQEQQRRAASTADDDEDGDDDGDDDDAGTGVGADLTALLECSTLRSHIGNWENRIDAETGYSFFFLPTNGELRVSLSPRRVHHTLAESSQHAAAASSRRSARSIPMGANSLSARSSGTRSMEWQYRYGYEYDEQGQLVRSSRRDARPVWTEHVDEPSGMTYYYNHVTQEYRWECPEQFGLPFDKYAETSNSSRIWFQEQQRLAQQEHGQAANLESSGRSTGALTPKELSARATLRKARTLGKKWIECVDPETKHTYYYNEITGESRWSLSPRSARDDTDRAEDISLDLFARVKELRESGVMYSAREQHMAWLEDAMTAKDWKKVDVLVHQIQLREQSERVSLQKEEMDERGQQDRVVEMQQRRAMRRSELEENEAAITGTIEHSEELLWASTGRSSSGVTRASDEHNVWGDLGSYDATELPRGSSATGDASPDWQEVFDGEGSVYYYNTTTGETSWTLPISTESQ